jgi:ABC-type antimicrobial peptide transport system ATPase subunit
MAQIYTLLDGLLAANPLLLKATNSSGRQSAHFDITQLPPLGHRKDVATMAKNICQSVEYCLEPEHRGLGAKVITFPLKVAIETLHEAHCERELQWAKAIMEKLDRMGVRIMRHFPVPLTDHNFLP